MTDEPTPPQQERPPRRPAETEPVQVDELAGVRVALNLTRGQLADMTEQAGQALAGLGQVQQELANVKRDHREAKAAWDAERVDLLGRIADLEGPREGPPPGDAAEPARPQPKVRRRESVAADRAAEVAGSNGDGTDHEAAATDR